MTHLHRGPFRLSTFAGSLGACLMLLSGPVHSLSGWPALRTQLADLNAPAALTLALRIGWHFAGGAMATFGLMLLHLFVSRARGGVGSMLPAWTIGGLYVVFGVGALVASGFDPFFLVFIIPGGLVLIGVVSALLVRRSLPSAATQTGVR